ncbi:Cyclic AMP-inducible protein BP74 [Actinoplanes sp. SE50]|uniref:BP74-related protein n=1 Tax=unclassified Actinoplanes TaxID=2626549 RepID=UPI00023EBD4F|nr:MULTISPECIES: hypothetical protein [unclassified Actinoplanes]AEV85077.1 Cyclic AMP-inducible protein BP74 [Actinoplanes sp. SE50/110]ATO83468.1 Cyclic AMP-inducible protein BP74 [Actinoplanes sp. SE50]SLM00875.1 uncharacterized protein ACSP50_4108 [Actinoplanes sp. SE50/110]
MLAIATGAAAVVGAVPPGSAAAADIQVSYIATIRVDSGHGAEYFQARLTDPADVRAATDNMQGVTNQHINGRVVYTGADVNKGYTWHLDPADVSFVDQSMELCDGAPSYVAGDPNSYTRYCPWHSKVQDLRVTYTPYRPRG